jgi:hypothetical protein
MTKLKKIEELTKNEKQKILKELIEKSKKSKHEKYRVIGDKDSNWSSHSPHSNKHKRHRQRKISKIDEEEEALANANKLVNAKMEQFMGNLRKKKIKIAEEKAREKILERLEGRRDSQKSMKTTVHKKRGSIENNILYDSIYVVEHAATSFNCTIDSINKKSRENSMEKLESPKRQNFHEIKYHSNTPVGKTDYLKSSLENENLKAFLTTESAPKKMKSTLDVSQFRKNNYWNSESL